MTGARRGPNSTSARTASRRRCSTGASEQDKVAQYLYNVPEYLESVYGRGEGRDGARQHQLPVSGRRTGLPLGQRRRRRRGVPGALVDRVEEIRPRLPGLHCSCGSTTTLASARLGPSRTRRRDVGDPSASRPNGDDRATTSTCSTPGGRPGMPKGVMWQIGDLIASYTQRTTAPSSGGRRRTRPEAHPGMPAHARDGRLHGVHRPSTSAATIVTLTKRNYDAGRTARRRSSARRS